MAGSLSEKISAVTSGVELTDRAREIVAAIGQF